jgi:hypothetical protein
VKAVCSTSAAFVEAATAALQVTAIGHMLTMRPRVQTALPIMPPTVGLTLLQDAQLRGIACVEGAFDGSQAPRDEERDRVFVLSPACSRLQARDGLSSL